jgi:hypothetical protein
MTKEQFLTLTKIIVPYKAQVENGDFEIEKVSGLIFLHIYGDCYMINTKGEYKHSGGKQWAMLTTLCRL